MAWGGEGGGGEGDLLETVSAGQWGGRTGDDSTTCLPSPLRCPSCCRHCCCCCCQSADPMHFQPLHDTAYIPGSACSSRLLLLLGQRPHCFLPPLPAALIPVPFLHIVHSTTWGAGGAADAIGKGIPSVPSLPAALEAGGSSGAAAAAPADAFSPCTVIDRREEDGSRTVAFEVGMGGEKHASVSLRTIYVFSSTPRCTSPSPSFAQGRHIAVFRDVVAVEWRGKRVEGADTVAQIT